MINFIRATFLLAILSSTALPQDKSWEADEDVVKQTGERSATAINSGVLVPFTLPASTQTTIFRGDYSYTIQVPAGATQLLVELQTQTPNADVDLYVRKDLDVERQSNGRPLADYISEGLTGNETITISSPPAGTYYIAFGLFTLNVSPSATVRATVTGGNGGGGATPANGTWTGTTGQGRTITFTVLNNAITQLIYTANWNAGAVCPTSSTTTSNNSIPITNGSFSNSTISGTFSSSSAASGTLHAVLSIPPPQNCNQTVDTTWSASTSAPPPPPLYSISGQVRDGTNAAVSGVLLVLSGGGSASVQTNANGDYALNGITSNLTYTVTPSKSGCTFNPPSRSYSPLSSDQFSQNYTASCQSYTLTIAPTSVTLYPSQSQNFNITVAGPSAVGVNTSLAPSLGTLTSGCSQSGSCVYMAPSSISSPQTVALTSITTNGAAQATATITLQPCTYSLSTNSLNLTSSASPVTVSVTAASPCAWSATSNASWLTVNGGSGSGNGSFTLAATANVGAPRTTTVTLNTSSPQVITVTQQGSTSVSSGLRFVPVTPCRILETRAVYAGQTWTGNFGPPRLTGGATRTIPVTSSPNCSIPSSAKAFVFNATLDTVQDGTGPVDFVTIWPTGEARPTFRTLSTTTGGYIANGAIVKAGTNGSVDVYATNNVNLLLDINGYFTDDPNAGLLYYPFGPCRAVDTRGPIYSSLPAPFGNQKMQRAETRKFKLPQSPNCQIPAASAYSFQMTLAPGDLTNGLPVAYVTAWPSDKDQPIISNMNSLFGYALANSSLVPASFDGSVSVFAFDTTNLILDVNGYFAPDDGTGRGLYYYPVTQCRVLNTQDASFTGSFGPPQLAPNADRSVPIPSSAQCPGLPSTAKAWEVNATVIPNGSPMPFLSMWPDGTGWPGVSQLNAFQGQTVSNSAIVPGSSNGSILVKVNATTHVILEVAGYFSR